MGRHSLWVDGPDLTIEQNQEIDKILSNAKTARAYVEEDVAQGQIPHLRSALHGIHWLALLVDDEEVGTKIDIELQEMWPELNWPSIHDIVMFRNDPKRLQYEVIAKNNRRMRMTIGLSCGGKAPIIWANAKNLTEV